MHRNTFLVIVFLGIIAVTVIVRNALSWFGQSPPLERAMGTPTPKVNKTASHSASNKALQSVYVYGNCAIKFEYPRTHVVLDDPDGGIAIARVDYPNDTVWMECNKTIPRPQIDASMTESLRIGTVSAILYKDYDPQEGKALNKFIFRNPKNRMDIQISGIGEVFHNVIKSVNIL